MFTYVWGGFSAGECPKLATFRTKITFRLTPYIWHCRFHRSASRFAPDNCNRIRRAVQCFRRAKQPIHSILFFKPGGTFRPDGYLINRYLRLNWGLNKFLKLSALSGHCGHLLMLAPGKYWSGKYTLAINDLGYVKTLA